LALSSFFVSPTLSHIGEALSNISEAIHRANRLRQPSRLYTGLRFVFFDMG
jgi:F0F1-type ATP synthase membrane subunit b/b'